MYAFIRFKFNPLTTLIFRWFYALLVKISAKLKIKIISLSLSLSPFKMHYPDITKWLTLGLSVLDVFNHVCQRNWEKNIQSMNGAGGGGS